MAERGANLQIYLKKHSRLEQSMIEAGLAIPESQVTYMTDEIMKTYPADKVDTVQQLLKVRRKLNVLMPSHSKSKTKEKSILIIDTDIPRTFSYIEALTDERKQKLTQILQAFTMYRPDIGYVQGMSYVAAMLLLHTDNPFMTFVMFCTLMTKFPILPFFNFNDVLIRKIMQLYKQIFAYNLPELCEHFELEGI